MSALNYQKYTHTHHTWEVELPINIREVFTVVIVNTPLTSVVLQEAELPQFTIMGWETNERKIKLATGTYQVTSDSDDHQ